MSLNSRLKATNIIGQRKAFYRQRIPESSCARKETADMDILKKAVSNTKKLVKEMKKTLPNEISVLINRMLKKSSKTGKKTDLVAWKITIIFCLNAKDESKGTL